MMSLAFAFLCFTGIFVMFLYLMRNLEKFQEHMRDEHAQLRVQLRALEDRLEAFRFPAERSEQSLLPAQPEAPDKGHPLTLEPRDPVSAVLEDPVMQFEPRRD